MAETPRFAHFMILLLMGAEFSVALGLATSIFAALTRRKFLALLAGGGAIGIAAGYTCLLLGVGWLSGEKTLGPGRWKYFCEADCHIAYAIEDVQANDAGGAAAERPSSRGASNVSVRLKTWFDENSIASFRGDRPLAPEPRRVLLVDSAGRSYPPLPEADAAPGARSTRLTQPLRPGESYTTQLAFEVPADARDLRLLIMDADPATRYIIDHENSSLHGKIYLRLPEPGGPAYSELR